MRGVVEENMRVLVDQVAVEMLPLTAVVQHRLLERPTQVEAVVEEMVMVHLVALV
jgi:hypothetical protein